MSTVNETIEDESFQALSLGSEGSMVLFVQKMLNFIEYHVAEDGDFSEDMESKVKAFQATRKKLVSNGIVDHETMEEMDLVYAKKKRKNDKTRNTI
jgi:N-acetyl-anhydromuramyl-L-alanine amidase AmpD